MCKLGALLRDAVGSRQGLPDQGAISSGQTSGGVIVLSDGTLDILSGGTAFGTTVNSGGSEIVSSGGTASNTTVSSGGSLVVLSHGISDPATIYSAGSETVSSGGTDLGAYISGGIQVDLGLVSGVTVYAGSQVVRSDPPITGGAVATNSETGSGSEGIGGVPGSGTTVHSGGYEFGGTQPAEANGVFFSGGHMMQLDSLFSQFAGVISGFDLGDEIGPHSLGFGSSSTAMSWGGQCRSTGHRQGRQHLQPHLARAVCGQFRCQRGRP
jgi:autotransporter passenger strand-loop-strand repeat protein